LADRNAGLQESWKWSLGSEEQFIRRQNCPHDFLPEGKRDIRAARLYEKDPKDSATRFSAGAETNEGNFEMTKNKHRGPTLNSFLIEEGIHEELKAAVAKEAISWQLEQAMKKQHISKKKLAELMDTSRTQIDRILDPKAGNVTLETLQRAARIVGRELRVELV
jgi:antitoxin HicB